MTTFLLHLQDATHYERIEGVASFVGEDASGCFGIRAGHGRLMTSLIFGLARYRLENAPWQYLALPRALLYFVGNELFLNTRRFFRDSDYERIKAVLEQQLASEEQALQHIREGLHRMEDEMLKRLWDLSRRGKTIQ